MQPQNILHNAIPSPPTPSEDGLKMEKWSTSKPLVLSDSTKLPVSNTSSVSKRGLKRKRNQNSNDKSATLVSAASTKRHPSNVKSTTSKSSTQTTNSSKTLDLVSIGNEEGFSLFWTPFSTVLSKNLSSATKTDCVDLGMTSWNTSARRLAQNSWYSVRMQATAPLSMKNPNKNSQRTSSPWLTSLLQRIMGCAQHKREEIANEKRPKKKRRFSKKAKEGQPPKEEKPPAHKAMKVRVYPSKADCETLKQWMGTLRWVYNQCIAKINEMRDNKEKVTIQALRKHCVEKSALEEKGAHWALSVPYDIRGEGALLALTAYKSNIAKWRLNPSHRFQLSFKTKKDPQQIIPVHRKHLLGGLTKTGKQKKTILTGGKRGVNLREAHNRELIPQDIGYDTQLVRNLLGHYHLVLLKPLEMRVESQDPQKPTVALDPGVRTFQTTYDTEGQVTHWGASDIQRVFRLCYTVDKLQSRWSQKDVKHRKRYRLKKAAHRIRLKIKNLVRDLHCKMSKWLCENHSLILIPSFETSRMVVRNKRRIRSKTARAMLTWSHYSFKQRLLHKCKEYPECHVQVVNESYTSKTCGACGHIHYKLGGSKVFTCPSCRGKFDRDVNGARNILIRFLTRFQEAEEKLQE